MIVLVCGLSGSGKSSMIAALQSQEPSVIHVRASKLLRDAGRPIEHISKEDASSNQETLAALLQQELPKNASLVLLDGHLLIETATGPYLLSDTALGDLNIDGVIFVAADPEVVSVRRQSTGAIISKEELNQLMQLEAEQAQKFAYARGIQCACVESGDIEDLKSKLFDILRR